MAQSYVLQKWSVKLGHRDTQKIYMVLIFYPKDGLTSMINLKCRWRFMLFTLIQTTKII